MKILNHDRAFVILVAIVIFVFHSGNVASAYTDNAVGDVILVWTYGNIAAIKISPMPATGCTNSDFFYIHSGVFSEKVNLNLAHSIALTAKITGNQVNVGYDSNGTGCINGRPEIYRIDLM